MATLTSGSGIVSGHEVDRGSNPQLGDASDYMSPAYVARHASEPSIQQKAERQRQAKAQAEISVAIAKAYPKEPVAIRMVRGSVGTVLHTGFDNALRAIACGNAELVKPEGAVRNVPPHLAHLETR